MSHNEHIFKNENSYFHIKKQCMICWNWPGMSELQAFEVDRGSEVSSEKNE